MTTRSGRRYRRARRLRSGKRGVVAVIGTLLALLVFFALFGIFLTQYVPLWMTDNEAEFTNSVSMSFAQFKSGIDSQYVFGTPPTLGTPFTISSDGVPLIAQPTEGTLSYLAQTCPAGFAKNGQPVQSTFCVFENQSISPGPGGSRPFHLSDASGVLEMQLPNRYYSSQTFYYEDDGVVQSQSPGYEVMAFPPPFNVTRAASGNTTVTSSFLELFGNATSVIAQGSQEVYSHPRFTQEVIAPTNLTVGPFTYTFEVGTEYPCAWSQFLSSQMNVSGVSYSPSPSPGTMTSYNFTSQTTNGATRVPYTGGCTNPTSSTTVIILNVYTVSYANLFYAGMQVNIGIGGI